MPRNRKNKNRKSDGSLNINVTVNGNTVNIGKKQRRKTLKRKTRKTKSAKIAPAENRRELPSGVDLDSLHHASHMCIATNYIHAQWSHEPMIRFTRKNRKAADGKTNEHMSQIMFNDECNQKFGLNYRSKLAVFTDRKSSPRYILFQNAVRHFECPAHVHKLGFFDMFHAGGKPDNVVRKTGNGTFLGAIGNKRHIKTLMQLFYLLPNLENHTAKLYQVEGNPNLFFAKVSEIEAIPTANEDKLSRVGNLVDDNLNVRQPSRFQLSLPTSLN